MPTPDAHVRRATLHAVASDAEDALLVLHAAEAVLHRALEAAAVSAGEEVVVLRKVELRFSVELDGRSKLTDAQMEHALRGAIQRRVASARARASGPVVTDQTAWFPSEASAIGELLAAHAEGRAAAWPYRSLTLWGATPAGVLRTCLGRGRVALGDVLAGAIRRLGAGGILALVPDDLAAAIVAAWTEGAGDRSLAASALPADLRAAIAAEIAGLAVASEAQREVVTLARLFALWPPARDVRIPRVELRLLLAGRLPTERSARGSGGGPSPGEPPAAGGEEEAAAAQRLADLLRGTGAEGVVSRLPADVVAAFFEALRRPPEGRAVALAAGWSRLEEAGIPTEALRRAIEGAPRRRLVSAAGGLLAWAALFEAEGLADEIAEAYPELRVQRAVRWAVGRALEDARIGGADPTLLLWAGEDPGALVAPAPALAAADPAPLHRRAVRLAAARGLLGAPLEAARFGDFIALMSAGGICVDAILAERVHDAVPELVRRFVARAGAPPAGIQVAERLRGDAADALVEVDVPPLPEAWRVAVRAFASLARSALERRWRARAAETRGWPAIVEIGEPPVVEIARAQAARIYAGSWLREDVRLGGQSVRIRAK
jgi:hypothetical protein